MKEAVKETVEGQGKSSRFAGCTFDVPRVLRPRGAGDLPDLQPRDALATYVVTGTPLKTWW